MNEHNLIDFIRSDAKQLQEFHEPARFGNGDKTVSAVKRSLSDKVSAVYGCVHDTLTVAAHIERQYNLVALVEESGKSILFFDNDALKDMLAALAYPEELSCAEFAMKYSGKPPVELARIQADLVKALSLPVSESKSMKPLPGFNMEETDISCISFLFNREEEENLDTETADMLDWFESIQCLISRRFDRAIWMMDEPGGWSGQLAKYWLLSVFEPEYPYFDVAKEKEKYLEQIDKLIDEFNEDKDNIIHIYLEMLHATEGHDEVIVDFINDCGFVDSIPLKAEAFKSWCTSDGIEDFSIAVENFCSDKEVLAAVAENMEYDEEDGLLLNRDDILAIRDGDSVLWCDEDNYEDYEDYEDSEEDEEDEEDD